MKREMPKAMLLPKSRVLWTLALALSPLPVAAQEAAAAPAAAPAEAVAGSFSWLAGDHHIHSRFSVGWDRKDDPPSPILGAEGTYPIPMNALMARHYGLAWTVSTDHGGPNHSEISLERIYPELVLARELLPELVQFFGMELNTPAADHSTIVMPRTDDEAERLVDIESRFDVMEAYPFDASRNTENAMLAALLAMDALDRRPVVFANHPGRSARGIGEFGLDQPQELRGWNDAAPEVAVGMEGAPGHQASSLTPAELVEFRYPRGAYRVPTLGGFDQMSAVLGGFWDSMLGEGRRWWITASSDSHEHYTDGGPDFWPGEYSKTYVWAERNHDSILEALRAGRIFVTTGDLVSQLYLSVRSGDDEVQIGGDLEVASGSTVEVTLSFRGLGEPNANGDLPQVRRVDLIRGLVTGRLADPAAIANDTTEVIARFEAEDWSAAGGSGDSDLRVMTYTLENVTADLYLRVRGTNTEEPEPEPDPKGEDPWTDLWFYSNPVFVRVE